MNVALLICLIPLAAWGAQDVARRAVRWVRRRRDRGKGVTITGEYLNRIQEEIVDAVEGAGIALHDHQLSVDESMLEAGDYCQKGEPGCFCRVGWPVDRQCADCREAVPRDSYCVCH